MLAPSALHAETRRALEVVGRTLFIATWPEIPLAWNRRLRRAGRAVIDTQGRRFLAATIELSPAYFEVYPNDLPGILVHEAVHVGLAVLGRDFGHGPAFQQACAAAGGLLHSRELPGRVFRYRCPVCGEDMERRRRAADSRWCPACVAAAEAAGLEPFAAERAMRLVATRFVGPEGAGEARHPVCESAAVGAGAGTPLEYPVRAVDEHDPA